MGEQIPANFAVAMEELAFPIAVQDGAHIVTVHRAGPKHEARIFRSKMNGVEVLLRLLIQVHRFCVAGLDDQLVANLIILRIYGFHAHRLNSGRLIDVRFAIQSASIRCSVGEVNIALPAIQGSLGLRDVAFSAGDGGRDDRAGDECSSYERV